MKVIYIAGPYRARTEREVERNIREAEALAIQVWLRGAAAICPHLNTAHLGGIVDDQVFLDGDLEIINRCDAVLCTDRWEQSVGAQSEVLHARELGIPVFREFAQFVQFMEFSRLESPSAPSASSAVNPSPSSD